MVVQNSTECLNNSNGDGTLTREECSLIPKASLICRPNSHPFQDRVLQLDQPIKVGRSVARARPVSNNAIFDCKVLSRNHALLWYENGKFFLQDTKSSNGTFVNNQRLSKGSEESPPREVCSGDILQFGVDVMENSQKVTHGCIISTLRLFLPDGKEAKASPTIVNTTAETSIPTQDLYQLNQYIQESLAREKILENKLKTLVKLVQDTEIASSSGWKALMDEDRLLTRVEILEGQLTTYGKNMNEEKLREEAKRLMEEKEAYQRTAKDTLKKLVDEKLEALKNLKEVEKSFKNAEDELASLKVLYDRVVEENRNLSVKITELQEAEVKQEKEEKIVRRESLYSEDMDGVFDDSVIENCSDSVKANGKLRIGDGIEKNAEDSGESLDGTKLNDSGENNENALDMNKMMEEVQNLTHLVDQLQTSKVNSNKQIMNLNLNLEECQNENAATSQELDITRKKLVDVEKLVTAKEEIITSLENKLSEIGAEGPWSSLKFLPDPLSPLPDTPTKIQSVNNEDNPELQVSEEESLEQKCVALLDQIQLLQKENAVLKVNTSSSNVDQKKDGEGNDLSGEENVLEGPSCDKSVTEDMSLAEAEEKIAGLLKIKEKLVKCQAEKSLLEEDLENLKEDISTITLANRSVGLFTILPVLVLLVAILIAFLPSIASLFGTNEF